MRTVILAGSLVDGITHGAIAGAAIVMEDGWIRDVVTSSDWRLTRGAEIVDCTDLTIVPGMIDAHVHLTFSSGVDHPSVVQTLVSETESELAWRALSNAQAALRSGVTTVRDCGARGFVSLAVRDEIRAGTVAGPRILACGMPITKTDGHLHYCGLTADTADEAVLAVQRMCEAGADFIKICASGGFMTSGSDPLVPQYSADELEAVVTEAHRRGRHVAAHVLNATAVRRCVAAGTDTLEHCMWQTAHQQIAYDPTVTDDIVRKGLFVGVTMSGIVRRLLPTPTDTPEETASKRANLRERLAPEREMWRAGVRMMLHSDAGVRFTPFAEFAPVLEAAVKGMDLSPLEAIGAVTRVPAEALRLDDHIGTIEPGKRGDVVAVEGDPTTTITDIGRVRHVWRGGRMAVRDGRLTSSAAHP